MTATAASPVSPVAGVDEEPPAVEDSTGAADDSTGAAEDSSTAAAVSTPNSVKPIHSSDVYLYAVDVQ